MQLNILSAGCIMHNLCQNSSDYKSSLADYKKGKKLWFSNLDIGQFVELNTCFKERGNNSLLGFLCFGSDHQTYSEVIFSQIVAKPV